jgi:hypothetical protein
MQYEPQVERWLTDGLARAMESVQTGPPQQHRREPQKPWRIICVSGMLSNSTTVRSGAVENRAGAYSTIGSIHTMYRPTGIFTGGIAEEGLAPRLDTPARRAGIMRGTPV